MSRRPTPFVALTALLFCIGCASPPDRPRGFDAAAALETVAYMADDAQEGRVTGSEGNARARAWLVQRMTAMGLTPVGEDGFATSFQYLPRSRGKPQPPVTGVNLLARITGTTPGAGPLLVVSAHHDHLGVRGGEIYNGADDNASGTAGLLALAEALSVHGPLRRSVVIVWLTAEEKGLLGARGWADDVYLPDDGELVCNVNLDMIGRNAPEFLEVTPTFKHPRTNRLGTLAGELAREEGFTDLASADKDFNRSDHYIFATQLRLPVVYLSGGEHDDYHQPSDTADKIDAHKIARVMRVVLRLLEQLQEEELRLLPEAEPESYED